MEGNQNEETQDNVGQPCEDKVDAKYEPRSYETVCTLPSVTRQPQIGQ